MTDDFSRQIAAGERFSFGENWAAFLGVLDEGRIRNAESALLRAISPERLRGRSLLDIGSGSGLHSLCARRQGAVVRSFDYDPKSVACTQELRRRYLPADPEWIVERGSALDEPYMRSLGLFDVVYAWGVLHHTGDMWRALDLAQSCVKPGGLLLVALYNDQGGRSRIWRKIKRTYCSGRLGRWLVTATLIPYLEGRSVIGDLIRRRSPMRRHRDYKLGRGMSQYYDYLDWLGGYPFEVAKPEDVLDFFRPRGFELVGLRTTNGEGNNQFVFERRLVP